MHNLPDDVRERNRKKWETQKSAEQVNLPSSETPSKAQSSTSATSASHESSAPATSSSAEPSAEIPADENLPQLRKLHVLPLAERATGRAGLKGNLDIISPKIREMRTAKTPLQIGSIFQVQGFDYCIVGVEPARGWIGFQTEFFLEGDVIKPLDKIQFLSLTEHSSATLFQDFIGPFCKTKLNAPGIKNQISETVVMSTENLEINGLHFWVARTEPHNIGSQIVAFDRQTLMYVDPDTTPEFDKIHVVPFQDTLPRAYEYEVFNDYVKPFFKGNKHLVFEAQQIFTYQGVQFKVVCCEPDGPRRVGRQTTIYCEGVLHPSLRNLLPPELLLQLSYLPPGLQMLLLNTDAMGSVDVYERLMDVQDMLQNRRGMHNDTIDAMEQENYKENDKSENKQTQCMICLMDFEDEDKIRTLPCAGQHVFHCLCIDEWLRRCTDCPICKTNIDRVVRNY